MYKVFENGKQLEIIGKFDLAVIGAGIAGISSAIAASRNGIKVCIIEKENLPGGLVLGLVPIYVALCDGKGHKIVGGIGEELLKESIKYGPGDIPKYWREESTIMNRKKQRYSLVYNPFSFVLSLEELVLKNNIKILYNTYFSDLYIKDNEIKAIIIENRLGRFAISTKYVIDASGDAIVCFKAKEDTVSIEPEIVSSIFYIFKENNVELCALDDDPSFSPSDDIKLKKVDKWNDISNINIKTRKLIISELKKLKKSYSNVYPVAIPLLPLVRMLRRLKSSFELNDLRSREYFDDTIGMIGDWRKKGPIYYIPIRSILGERVKNLLAVGRCISVSNKMWNITRVIPACAVTGQAAGTIVALAVNERKKILELDIRLIQKVLKTQGVIIEKNPKKL